MFLESFLNGSLILLCFMAVGFVFSRILKLTSVIDVFWPLGPLILCFYLLPRPITLENSLLLFCLLAWSLRLSIFILWTRILKNHEDSRYKEIFPKKNSAKKNILVFFQFIFQGFLQILLGISFLPFHWSQTKPLYSVFGVGFILAILAICGETKADMDVLKFKKENSKGILDTGLWAYSRHPNYFFDWLFWLSIGIMGASLSWGGVAFVGSFVMWIIFNYLTGPLTERLSLKKHKALYLYYQEKVPFMIPKISFFR